MSQQDLPASYLQWHEVPKLKDPFMVIGFHGWSDAGSVSSDTISHLVENLRPRVFATFTSEPFINYTMDRPIGQIEDGLIIALEPMVTELAWWSNPRGENDLVVVLGKEPHFGWLLYGQVLFGAMERLSVRRLYTIGGVQDTISHATPPQISVVGTSADVVETIVAIEDEIEPADYYGPVSIHSCLLKIGKEKGVEGLSLWGHAPPYLQKNPRIVAKLVRILNNAGGMECPVDDLMRRSIELDRKINEILAKDPNLKQLVETIEGKKRSGTPSPGSEKIIRLNDFLRRDSTDDPHSK